jgi:hypothetical protein
MAENVDPAIQKAAQAAAADAAEQRLAEKASAVAPVGGPPPGEQRPADQVSSLSDARVELLKFLYEQNEDRILGQVLVKLEQSTGAKREQVSKCL